MVLCELVVGDDDHEQKQKQAMKAPPPPLVEVLRVSCGLLYCQQKFYVIDPTMPKFDEKRICQVNPQEDGLYTMHYVTLVSGNGDLKFRDGPVAETWHDRWRPTLRELMTFLQEADMMHPWLFRQRAVFDGLLRPHLSVAKVLLLLGAGSAPEAAVGDGGEANPTKKRQKKLVAMETKKAKRESEESLDAQKEVVPTTSAETGKQAAADTPQMARMALVLESAVVNAIELIEVAAEMPVEACPVVLATSLQQ